MTPDDTLETIASTTIVAMDSTSVKLRALEKDYTPTGFPPAVLVNPAHKVIGIDTRKRKHATT